MLWKKQREISERETEEHTTVTESKEVVLGFIDVVNTAVNCAITGNPVSLGKKKKKVTY